jgi:predicted small metal-binding protein
MATQSNTQQGKKAGTRTAWQFACTDEDGTFSDCGYLQRNHDLEQLVRVSQMHAKDSHKVDAPLSYFEGASKKVAY